MKRLIYLVPLALLGLLLFFVFDTVSRRGRVDRVPAASEEKTATARDLPSGDWDEPGPELGQPVVLRGTVFDPHGRPVRRAEVSSLLPRPYKLAFTAEDGTYELAFERAGRYLIEGRLTIDLAPQREIVEIPEEGDPPRLDFHLRPTGHVFGEVVVEQMPVFDGGVEIGVLDLFGDTELAEDTDVDNGFFNFYWAPPRDVKLRLLITTLEGYMERPVDFTYTGVPVNLGRIKLTRYPTLKVRMKLPDGEYGGNVKAARVADFRLDRARGRFRAYELIGWKNKIIVQTKSNVTARLVLQSDNEKYTVARDVEMVLDQLRELEVVIRPGPFNVRRRLVDERGEPIQARLRLVDTDETTETSEDGFFNVAVPHGGLFTAKITELLVGEHGWLPLRESPDAAFLIDADDTQRTRFPLGGRVLFLASGDFSANLQREGGSTDAFPASLEREVNGSRADRFAVLTRRMEPGPYRWTRGFFADGYWKHPALERGHPLTLESDQPTLLDVR